MSLRRASEGLFLLLNGAGSRWLPFISFRVCAYACSFIIVLCCAEAGWGHDSEFLGEVENPWGTPDALPTLCAPK